MIEIRGLWLIKNIHFHDSDQSPATVHTLSLPEIDDKMADRGSFGALKMAADLIVKCMGKKERIGISILKTASRLIAAV